VRALGPILLVVLLALGAGLRLQAHQRASVLQANEERALERTYRLYRASRAAVRRGPHPGLAALLSEHPGLVMLPELGDAEHEYAADEAYIFGLTRPSRRGQEGATEFGYILRSWPLHFGVSGDREFYAEDRSGFWQGQNELGRSGTNGSFPPPFPQPGIEEGRNSAWWQSDLSRPDHR